MVAFSWGRQKPPAGTPPLRGHPLTDRLQWSFAMNEGGGAVSDAMRGLVAAPVNGPMWGGGPRGAVVRYVAANSQYHNVPSTAALNIVGPDKTFSVACWFLLNSWRNFNGLVARSAGGTAGPFQTYVDSTGTLRLTIGNGAAETGVESSTGTVAAGVWHLLAFAYDGTARYIYLDGQLSNSRVVAATPGDSANPLRFGNRTDNATLLDGAVESVFGWRGRVLSAADVALLYREPYGMFGPPPSRRWYVRPVTAVYRRTLSPFGARSGSRQAI